MSNFVSICALIIFNSVRNLWDLVSNSNKWKRKLTNLWKRCAPDWVTHSFVDETTTASTCVKYAKVSAPPTMTTLVLTKACAMVASIWSTSPFIQWDTKRLRTGALELNFKEIKLAREAFETESLVKVKDYWLGNLVDWDAREQLSHMHEHFYSGTVCGSLCWPHSHTDFNFKFSARKFFEWSKRLRGDAIQN